MFKLIGRYSINNLFKVFKPLTNLQNPYP